MDNNYLYTKYNEYDFSTLSKIITEDYYDYKEDIIQVVEKILIERGFDVEEIIIQYNNQNDNDKILKEKLELLIHQSGFIILSIGEYYIQFSKHVQQDKIYFECVSHNSLDILSKKIEPEFQDIGFFIDKGNYFKNFQIDEIPKIINECKFIFEDIYRINYNIIFTIEENIDNIIQQTNSVENHANNINNANFNKPSNKTLFVVIIFFFLGLTYIFSNKEEDGKLKIQAFIISKKIINSELASPKSSNFGSYDDSKVIYIGENKYQVTNTVDASNYFGAIINHNYYITLKYNGGDKLELSNWSAEQIEIK